MNAFLTIIIVSMLGTGALPEHPEENTAALQNIPPQALLYSVETKDNTNNAIDADIWQQITGDMANLSESNIVGVYLVAGNDMQHATRLMEIPMHDRSYSMNVPPSSQIFYVGKQVENGTISYSVNSVVNMQNEWVYISAVMRSGSLNLLTQNENKSFTALQTK